jgi:uncharacterized protein YlxP (DUF503 family)
MVVGAARIELHIHASRSLKQKRGVVRSLLRRVANRFEVSAAEVEAQDNWQIAVIGVAMVGIATPVVERRIENLIRFIEEQHLAEVVDHEVEVLVAPLAAYTDGDSPDGRAFDRRFEAAFGGKAFEDEMEPGA